jgi:uroporphyrinogen III methyltransferase/synthase
VTFVTGHEDPGKEESGIDWAGLGSGSGTVVFYMGVGRLGKIAANLIDHGRAPETPVAVIHRGTTEYQKTVVGTLEDIESKVIEADLKPPAVIVVGDVVGLREKLDWYETRPLFGRTVIVTRSREQASEFSRLLREQGARVIELPTIRIAPGPDPESVKEAIRRLAEYDWIVFTSANGVRIFLDALREENLDVRAMGKAGLCAIGPATAAALEASGLKVDLVPETYVAESVVDALSSQGNLSGKKVLLPRAEIARKVLPESLRALGALVDEIALYSTQIEQPENLDQVREQLAAGEIDLVTFTSSSTVENFVALLGEKALRAAPERTLFASIGPIAAAKAEEYGLKTAVIPESYTIATLSEAIRDYFSQGRS